MSRWPSSAVLGVVVAVVVAGVVADGLVDDTGQTVVAPTEATLAAGTSTCAAVALAEDGEVTASTVSLPTGTTDDADAAGSAELRLEQDGTLRRLATPPGDGSARATAVVGTTGDIALTARWSDAPLLLSRRWRVGDSARVPGSVEGPCPAEPARSWVVPGVATAGGAAATLHLANPTEAAASLSVTFTTPDGPVAPTRLANLAVSAHERVSVDLNEFVPEEPDLGVVVTTRAGRVVAEVTQTLEAAVGGVDGRALVPAETTPRTVWTIPWVSAAEDGAPWVWVTNPSDEPTDVRLVLHTEDGPVVPPDAGVSLPPDTTQRIDLRGALADVGTAAVTVRSAADVPIVASGAVLRSVPDDAVRGGFTVVQGLAATDAVSAAQSAVGASGRERVLALANPGEQDATVSVRVVGSSAAATTTVTEDLVLGAGSSTQLPLGAALPSEGGFAVVIEPVDGQVVAAMVTTSGEGPLDLIASAARPFPSVVLVTSPDVVRDQSLLHPVQRGDLDRTRDAPSPSPSPSVPASPPPTPTTPAPDAPAPATPAPGTTASDPPTPEATTDPGS